MTNMSKLDWNVIENSPLLEGVETISQGPNLARKPKNIMYQFREDNMAQVRKGVKFNSSLSQHGIRYVKKLDKTIIRKQSTT